MMRLNKTNMKFENRHMSYLAENVFDNILNLDEHEQPETNLEKDSISMLANNTWFDIPFHMPFNVLYMPNTMAYIVVEASIKDSARLSVYMNETTVTASKMLNKMSDPEARQKFEVPILLSQIRLYNRLTIGIQASSSTDELFHLHSIEIKTTDREAN